LDAEKGLAMSYDSPTKPITKPMLILTSHLTKTPVYYASQEYTAYPDGRVVVYGNKYGNYIVNSLTHNECSL
jgi:phage baseplate assembly protein gpV